MYLFLKRYLLVVSIFSSTISFSQNLVTNYSFECNTCCPNTLTYGASIGCVKSWDMPVGGGGSSDYWACPSATNPTYGTPSNAFGNQVPRTGNAYGGLYAYSKSLEYREYLQAPLIAPLQQGQCYEITFYVSMADIRSEYGVDRMGAYLSVGAVAQTGSGIIPVIPQVENPTGVILGSYTNWMKISGTFTAAGGENYITIGNFSSDANTTLQAYKPFPWLAYYWVDDVSIVECENDTTTACPGKNVLLNTQGGTQYTWSTGASSSFINVAPTSTTIYTVDITDTTHCSFTTDTFIVKTAASPVAAINSFTNVSCFGMANGAATGSASGGLAPYNYSWSASGQTAATISGLGAGTYSLIVTDGNGCSGSITSTITQPTIITTTVSNTNALCQGSGSGSATVQSSGGTPTYFYSWNNGQNNSTATGLIPGTYSVTITDMNGCTITTTATVKGATPIVLTISPSSQICFGQAATITSSALGGTPLYSYNWSSGALTSTITVSPTTLSNYSLVVTDANGCSNIAITSVSVNPLPVVSFTSDVTEGCSPLCVNFSNTSPSASSFYWDLDDGTTDNSSGPMKCYTIPGSYNVSLTITDANGCSNNVNQNNYITVYPNPIASFTATPSLTTLLNSTIQFTDLSTSATQWQWSFGDVSGSSSNIQHPNYTCPDTGAFEITLVITNVNGCKDTTKQTVIVIEDFAFYIPNSFSPNGDGLNDVFIPRGIGLQEKDFEFYVFDRWGNLIFTSNNLNTGWNGCVNNQTDEAQIDTYVWKVNIKDNTGAGHRYTGHVNIIR